MLTTMQIMSAAGVVAYFGREISTSEYYTAEHGVWYGKGAERLGLPSDLTKEDFVAIANNRVPQSGDRLTARTNDTRTQIVWELDDETQSRVPKEKEVNNPDCMLMHVCMQLNMQFHALDFSSFNPH